MCAMGYPRRHRRSEVGAATWMEAVVGHARESGGVVEVELMSPASVCELLNGRGVIRVLGSSPIIELLPETSDDRCLGVNYFWRYSHDVLCSNSGRT